MTDQSTVPADSERVLVLQGGGALGSYQAGAYEALCRYDFEPKWIAGISIGAINAAIIAGNPREKRVERLREFWNMTSSPVPWQPLLADDNARSLYNSFSATMIASFGVPGFFTPRFPPGQFWPTSNPANLSHYDTTPLRETLLRLIDFDRLNNDGIRLSLGAVNVKTGNFAYFDNTKVRIGPEHIMASGALPPGFPAVEVDGEYYWDGGLASNTPLDYVLDTENRKNLLIFQVDLFSARGPLPATMMDTTEREKDIRYSSRTRFTTDQNRRVRTARKAVRDLIARLPPEFSNDPTVAYLAEASKENTVTVVHLIYRRKTREQASAKDYNFSRINMLEHWASGIADVEQTVRHREGLLEPQEDETMKTFDLTSDSSDGPGGGSR